MRDEKRGPIDPAETRGYLQSEMGWEIEGPFYAAVPTPKPEYITRCAKDAERLAYHLLKTVIIKDKFDKDHSSRRLFERSHPEVDTYSSEYSKLGGNRLLTSVYAMDEVIERVRREYPQIAEKLKTTAKSTEMLQEIAGYNAMSFEDKVRFARKLDDVIYKFLSVLSE
ncbi:MAG: hypothetical protein WC817_05260 [Patescibacteria group bacterium]|jgi:hypothetical protein